MNAPVRFVQQDECICCAFREAEVFRLRELLQEERLRRLNAEARLALRNTPELEARRPWDKMHSCT